MQTIRSHRHLRGLRCIVGLTLAIGSVAFAQTAADAATLAKNYLASIERVSSSLAKIKDEASAKSEKANLGSAMDQKNAAFEAFMNLTKSPNLASDTALQNTIRSAMEQSAELTKKMNEQESRVMGIPVAAGVVFPEIQKQK
jgi:hypothetical protein